MVGKRLSATVRGQIIEAASWQPLGIVALRFQCAESTVSRLVRLKEAGRAEPPSKGSGGRPRTISDRLEHHLRATLLANRWQSPLEITILLKTEGIAISLSTIKRFMRKEGLRRYAARHKPFLSDTAKATRLAYAREHLMDGLDSWRRTICCDEAAIRLNYAARRFVTRYQGKELLEECLAPRLLSSRETIMLWGAVWYGGRSQLVLFDTSASTGKRGGVTTAIYCDQITSGPLRKAHVQLRDVWRGYGRPRILEDNAPIHTSALN